jgi:site-specific recombinase XerD
VVAITHHYHYDKMKNLNAKIGMRSHAENTNTATQRQPSDTPRATKKLTADNYMEAALSNATKRAYASDLREFKKWGGSIPATADSLVKYLTEMATKQAYATLQRRVITIVKATTDAGYESPTRSPDVKRLMQGIRRTIGTRQRQAKPIVKDDLLELLVMVDKQQPIKAARDRALFLIGFAGAFRRAELVSIRCEDICEYSTGMSILIQRSKTDQEGAGRTVYIPHASGARCPVAALKAYRAIAGIESGWLFRSISCYEKVSSSPLSAQSVSLILKAAAKRSGVDPSIISGHSLRAGYCTQAAIFGLQPWQIREQTGHKSDLVLARYIRPVAGKKIPSLL